jgi:hypothetical protein
MEDILIDQRIILKLILKNTVGMWAVLLIWNMAENSGGLL